MFSRIKDTLYDWLEEYGPPIVLGIGIAAMWAVVLVTCLQPAKHKYTTCTWNANHTVSVCTEEWK